MAKVTAHETKRGDIWWADLGIPRGSEPGKRRPVVIVQHDHLTRSRLRTVMVVPLTSNIKRASAIGNVLLPKKTTLLSVDSVALACQVETLDKVFLDSFVKQLDAPSMLRIDTALRLNLALSS